MQLAYKQRDLLIQAIEARRAAVVAERAEHAKPEVTPKWRDSDEAKARRLDAERDELDALAEVLSKPSGQLNW
jgi:hypothetical protein